MIKEIAKKLQALSFHIEISTQKKKVFFSLIIICLVQLLIEYPRISNRLITSGDVYNNILVAIHLKISLLNDTFHQFWKLVYWDREDKAHILSLILLPFTFILKNFLQLHLFITLTFNLLIACSIFSIFYKISNKYLLSALSALFLIRYGILEYNFIQYETFLVCSASLLLLTANETLKTKPLEKLSFLSIIFGFIAICSRPLEAVVFYLSFLIVFRINKTIILHYFFVFLLSAIWWLPGMNTYLYNANEKEIQKPNFEYFINWIFGLFLLLAFFSLINKRNCKNLKIFIFPLIFAALGTIFYLWHETPNEVHLSMPQLGAYIALIGIIISTKKKYIDIITTSFFILFFISSTINLKFKNYFVTVPYYMTAKEFSGDIKNTLSYLSNKNYKKVIVITPGIIPEQAPVINTLISHLELKNIENKKVLQLEFPKPVQDNKMEVNLCDPQIKHDAILIIEKLPADENPPFYQFSSYIIKNFKPPSIDVKYEISKFFQPNFNYRLRVMENNCQY